MRRLVHYFQHESSLSDVTRLALGAGLVGLMLPTSYSSAIDDLAPAVVETIVVENSVVVAKRKLDDVAPLELEEGDDSLQPIMVSDKEPQLADPEEHLMPKAKDEAVKVAANAAEVPASDQPEEPAELAAPEGPQPAQPAVFHGIQPGVSTKKQLIESWGSPDEVAPTDAGQLMLFQLESFRGVEVLVEDGLVTLMKINLRRALSPAELAEKIAADTDEAVPLEDPEANRVVAYAYPERGIVMVVDESDGITPLTTEKISQMILQPLDPDTFCLRAAERSFGELTNRIADLKQALKLAPREASIHWQLSQALSDAGLATEAEASAKRALDIEPENLAYRQQWAKTLSAVGKFDNAVITTREVLDSEGANPLIRAQALYQMGLLAALGDSSIAEKAIHFHNMAITEADKLATSSDPTERMAAKRLLVDAHLAIAVELSKQDYEDNMENVGDWVARASEIAEGLISNEGGDLGLRITVAERSLAALANFKPSNDPEPLIKEIEKTLETIKLDSDDPLWIDQLEWRAGVAYQHALEIEHHRRHPKQALEYSEKAIALMADKAEERRDCPQTVQQVGKLFFHIGAVHAVHQTQHGEAVKWYEKAIPLMTTQASESELLVPRHEGEALVSMAVSYWDQGERNRAIRLTEQGADLIEQAVTAGVMKKKTLAVPYGNLAAMHKKQGNMVEAQRYAKLVESLKTINESQPGVAEATESPAPQARTSQPRTQANRNTQRTRRY
ncbi:tetratricopeptide repeat protein [Aeoliella mucimassa]|uniref:Uncharacterized protein n=1 Tax=Aeoliella mucimassa TaxID=2527972 RepID=A0A518AHF6_9BACT|nr:hypothetical protein [Aeoliella mucimassa]QDU54173.1 hypothetical protein Pan181_03530 [Aeoliella mucimassa]